METITSITLVFHVIAGFTAFTLGPFAIFSIKNIKTHRIVGSIFKYAMAIVFFTAIFLSVYRGNLFLFMVALFSFYSVLSGVRILSLKKLHQSQHANLFDWLLHGIFILTNIAFISYGAYIILNFGIGALAILCFLFGFGGIYSVWGNIKPYLSKEPEKLFWLKYHLNNMTGAYIATVTAFSAQQLDFMPTLLQWTWPTLIITPIMSIYNRKINNRTLIIGN